MQTNESGLNTVEVRKGQQGNDVQISIDGMALHGVTTYTVKGRVDGFSEVTITLFTDKLRLREKVTEAPNA